MASKKKAKKRLVRGKDWHGWCYKSDSEGLYGWTTPDPKRIEAEENPASWDSGEWVRVKFVEVKP
jgi:hypothetical protein